MCHRQDSAQKLRLKCCTVESIFINHLLAPNFAPLDVNRNITVQERSQSSIPRIVIKQDAPNIGIVKHNPKNKGAK